MPDVTSWLTERELAERLSVGQSTIKAWRRNGILEPNRDFFWIPSTRNPQRAPTSRNLRYLWPAAELSIRMHLIPEVGHGQNPKYSDQGPGRHNPPSEPNRRGKQRLPDLNWDQ